MPYVIGFDFEAAGGIPALHGFTQLGAVLVDMDTDKVMGEFNMFSSMKNLVWEKRCVEEFWEKNPEKYKETLKGTSEAKMGPYEVVDAFVQWVQRVSKGLKDVYLLTDNAAFDAAILRFYSIKQDILYIFGSYRPIVESSRFYSGLARKPVTTESLWESSKDNALKGMRADGLKVPPFPIHSVEHDHNPVNDALVMALNWSHMQRSLKMM
jgi:DNA polymerase III epsilon subunit-like protein